MLEPVVQDLMEKYFHELKMKEFSEEATKEFDFRLRVLGELASEAGAIHCHLAITHHRLFKDGIKRMSNYKPKE